MASPGPYKHFVLAFVLALVLYIVTFQTCEHVRTRHGPWQVTFTNQSGVPALVIDEPQLNLSNITVSFPGQSASFTNETIRFNPPKEVPFALPFGYCIFEDTTFQPGTIVISNVSHTIQLMPRTLTIDRKEYPWRSGQTLAVTNKGMLPDAPASHDALR